MDFPIFIILMSPLSFLRGSWSNVSILFHFSMKITSAKMGRHVLPRHIWGYSVCLCPIKRTPGYLGFYCLMPSEIYKFECLDNGRRTGDEPLLYCKLILRALGSGQLRIRWHDKITETEVLKKTGIILF